MSIKSDKWIRRMAQEQALITPFEPGQIKLGPGGRLISYGTSSYGYDVRCAPEFKIFTNINSTIVDPKQFDEKSFVDVAADVCIIPPNSFALARTVEYFRIPRNVLVICLGKCVTADTRVVDAATGAYLPITEMCWGMSTLGLDNWRLKPAKVSGLMPQGKKEVFELRTRAGLRIRATENHPFRMLNGWVPLGELRPGDRIAAAGEIPIFGKAPMPDWEASLLGMMISHGQCNTTGHSPTYTSADPALVRLLEASVAAAGIGEVEFKGRFGYRIVNHRGRDGSAQTNRMHRWLAGHGLNVGSDHKFVPQAVFRASERSVRLFLQALFAGDGGRYTSGDSFYLQYYSNSRRLIEDLHHLLLRFGIFGLIREQEPAPGNLAYRIQIADKAQVLRFADRIGFVPGSIKQSRLEAQILPAIRARPRLKSNFDTLPREACAMVGTAARVGGLTLGQLNRFPQPVQSVPLDAVAKVTVATGDLHLPPLVAGSIWDVVETIEFAGVEDVYDICVPALQNFVANDLLVHNSTYARCGVIVNVTPLEPEWQGHVTLEFSNTTPLPAKIYANEGVAQMLFFESDEVCETSYADRGGKYQGQRGVTLPKA